MLSGVEWVLTWWHCAPPSACPVFSPVIQGKHPTPRCPPHCGSRFHSFHMVWAWLIVLMQQWSSPRQHQAHLFYVPYHTFSQFLTLLVILVPPFLCPSLFPNKQSARILFFPLISILLPPYPQYFWYYWYLDNLGPAMYDCFCYPGTAWPWNILLPFNYLSSLAISYNSSLASCEIQPVLMELSLLSFSHKYPAHPAVSHIW